MASQAGGAITSINTIPGVITGSVIITTSLFNGQYATDGMKDGRGGVFYFETGQVTSFTLTNSDIKNSEANANGGIYYVNQMKGGINILSSRLTDFKVSDSD